jgi:hypothetical protein
MVRSSTKPRRIACIVPHGDRTTPGVAFPDLSQTYAAGDPNCCAGANRILAEAAHRQEEVAVISALGVELQALRGTDPGMTLLNAAEFITPDPGRRITLYRYCRDDDRNIGPSGMGQDGPHSFEDPIGRQGSRFA